MTDQTRKREEGEKRVNRAAVIVAPTGSGDEGEKEGDEDGGCDLPRVQCPPDTGKEIPRE